VGEDVDLELVGLLDEPGAVVDEDPAAVDALGVEVAGLRLVGQLVEDHVGRHHGLERQRA
jgi:hypothetical protein